MIVGNIGVATCLPTISVLVPQSSLNTTYINNAVTVITADTYGTNFGAVLRTVWSVQ